MPENKIFPAVPAFKASAAAPFRVLKKLIFTPAGDPPKFVVSKVGVPVTKTGPVIVIIPRFVVMLPLIFIAVDPVYVRAPVVLADEVCVIVAAVEDILVKGVVPPTAPVKVVMPDPPVIVRA